MNQDNNEKLQKVLARLGVASRREAERMIEAGEVKVNGQTAHQGQRVTAADSISVSGRKVQTPSSNPSSQPRRVLIYNKPLGEMCTRSDPEGRPTVFGALPKLALGRWINVGRLDINSSGLLLFTTDGELAHRLMHPSYELTRRYRVRVDGVADDAQLKQLTTGVLLEEGMARFLSVKQHTKVPTRNCWYEVTLREGKNREVRRLWQEVGVRVSRLVRIAYGPVRLPKELLPGKYFECNSTEIEKILKCVKL